MGRLVVENTDPRFIIPKIKNYLKKETEGKVTILSLGEQVQIKDSSEEESTYFISSYKVENASSNIFMGDSDWKECGINPMWDNPGWSTSRDELIRMYKQ